MSEKCFTIHSDDFQTEEHVLSKDQLQDLAPEAREVLHDMLKSHGFEERDVAASKEEKQYVLQGQLLVLGDARTGKTSLVKALTGKRFEVDESKTKGVEFKYVNRKWKTLESQDMKFGAFSRHSHSFVRDKALWPRIFNQGRYRFRSGVVFGQELIFDNRFIQFLQQRCGINNLLDLLILHIIFHKLILPIAIVFFLGDPLARFVIEVAYHLVFLHDCITRQRQVSVITLFVLYFGILGSRVALWTFGCSDDPAPLRFDKGRVNCDKGIGWLLLRSFRIPLYIVNPFLFFFLALMSSSFSDCIRAILEETILKRLPVTWPVQLDFLFNFQDEARLPLMIFCSNFIFFYPIGLSCFNSSIAFPLESAYVFLLHLMLLYQQQILFKWYTGAALVLELPLALKLCVIGFDGTALKILSSIMLLFIGAALHIHGRWLEVKDDFKGKTFSQVFFHKDFIIYSIRIKKCFVDRQNLRNALNKTFSRLKIKILDFAGDDEYYAYHQIFLNSNALYAVVFDIQDCIKDNFKGIESKLKRLRFWLESIHSHVPPGTHAYIFLVGTHRANMDMGTLREINSYIDRSLGHSFMDEIVLNEKDGLMFFHVENSRGVQDDGVISLRKKIRSVAEEELKDVMGQEIPLSWVKVQDAILTYQESRHTPACLTIQDFKEMSDHMYLKWSEDMLKYFHKKGVIIYVSKDKNEGLSAEAEKDEGLSKWVLLNPNALVQIIILLISQPDEFTKKKGSRRHWALLKKSGMITKNLLHFIIAHATGDQATKESALITFLEEYDLICPLRDPFHGTEHLPAIKQVTHLVPSLLPPSPELPIWPESSEDIKFYIFFDSYVPVAFFYRLLSRSCKASYDEIQGYEPQIYRDCGMFWYSQQVYRLRIMKEEGLIEVTFTKPTGIFKPLDILLTIATRVEDIRNRDFHNLFFHCGPGCSSSSCPGSCSDSTSWLTGRPRRHVYNVYPACKPKGLKCLDDYFKCQNAFRKEDAMIWMP